MSYAGKFLSMVRMNNNESVEEMAKRFQISVDDLKTFEESELSIPKDWFQIIYDNYDIGPEEIMIMNDLMDDNDDIKRVDKSHTYKGYTVHIYGMRSMSIRDADGNEVFHTGFRNIVDPTIEEMEQAVEDYFKSHDHHFKWWFDIGPIRAIILARLKGGHRKHITGNL